jgi:LacI family transcriptional regulator
MTGGGWIFISLSCDGEAEQLAKSPPGGEKSVEGRAQTGRSFTCVRSEPPHGRPMSPASSARPVIGVRFPLWSALLPGVLSGIVDFMRRQQPWRLVTENDSSGEMEAVKLDRDWHGNGLIVFRATEEELLAWRQRGIAVVLTSTEGPDQGFPRVVPDNAEIGRLAAEHLLDCGVPHFAFLARGETLYKDARHASGLRRYSRERFASFRARLRQAGHEPEPHYLKGRPLWVTHTWREVESEVIAFLETLPVPCGLFVADDSLAAVVLRAAERLGRRVPEELMVMGFGDDPLYCFASSPTLSSIPYPARAMGEAAAVLLQRQLDAKPLKSPRWQIAVPAVVARESSDTLAFTDPDIRQVVRHIRLHAPHDSLRVAELATLSGLSLTTLKVRFKEVLGHGLKQEIQRIRLQHLRHLLSNPALSYQDISSRMKFGSPAEMKRFFAKETGESPREFRARQGATKHE